MTDQIPDAEDRRDEGDGEQRNDPVRVLLQVKLYFYTISSKSNCIFDVFLTYFYIISSKLNCIFDVWSPRATGGAAFTGFTVRWVERAEQIACSCYSVRAGSSSGTPRLYHFGCTSILSTGVFKSALDTVYISLLSNYCI